MYVIIPLYNWDNEYMNMYHRDIWGNHHRHLSINCLYLTKDSDFWKDKLSIVRIVSEDVYGYCAELYLKLTPEEFKEIQTRGIDASYFNQFNIETVYNFPELNGLEQLKNYDPYKRYVNIKFNDDIIEHGKVSIDEPCVSKIHLIRINKTLLSPVEI